MQEYEIVYKRIVGSGKAEQELQRTAYVQANTYKNAYAIAKKNRGKYWTLDKKDVHKVVVEGEV